VSVADFTCFDLLWIIVNLLYNP